MKTLWRQELPLHPSFEALDRSLEEDWFLFAEEIAQQRAHLAALRASQLLSPAELEQLLAALDELEREFGGTPCPASDAEDLHTWVEEELAARCGELGRRIHAGRSRNDQVATLLLLYALRAAREQRALLKQLVDVLAQRALEWAELAMPFQTHCQFAAPGSAGAWALRHAVALAQRRDSLDYFIDQWRRRSPLGSGAVAGSSVPIDRQIQATALGLESASVSALLSTGSRDECLELLAVDAHLAVHLSNFATDVIQFAQTPFGWVRYPRAFGSGSSMMPNKANPDAMELVRGQANAVVAAQAEALGLLRNLPSGYQRDLQAIKPVLWRATESLRRTLELLLAFVPALNFDRERLGQSMQQGDLAATFAMERKVRAGQSLRTAHAELAADLTQAAASSAALGEYQTLGSAKPEETIRVATALLRQV